MSRASMTSASAPSTSLATSAAVTTQRRAPLWAVLLAGWWLQVQLYPWSWSEAWRPEILPVIVTCVALRSTALRGALLGLMAGWLTVLCIPGQPWLLLACWLLLGYGLGWLRTQWYTEGLGLSVAIAWLAVMAWHGLTWLIKWEGGAAPRPWQMSFVIGQTCVTVACAAAWTRYAPRWVSLGIAPVDDNAPFIRERAGISDDV